MVPAAGTRAGRADVRRSPAPVRKTFLNDSGPSRMPTACRTPSVVSPLRRAPGDRRGRQPRGGAEKLLQRRHEVARRQPVQIQQREYLGDLRRLPGPCRQDRRGEPSMPTRHLVDALVVDPRARTGTAPAAVVTSRPGGGRHGLPGGDRPRRPRQRRPRHRRRPRPATPRRASPSRRHGLRLPPDRGRFLIGRDRLVDGVVLVGDR